MPFPALLAHALVGRQDLPIPEWLFAWGASLVLIVSFVALSLAWREPRLEVADWRPAPGWVSRALLSPATEVVVGAVGVFLLGVTVWSGLSGTESPDRNFAITFVFVTAWLGLVAVSVLFGDVFRAFNPWRAIGRTFGGVFRLVAGQGQPPPLAYPTRLGRWPAAVGLVLFLWIELVYGESGFGSVGLEPRVVAIAVLLYTVYTLTAMALFGIDEWIDRGETFSVYFGMFASISPLEARGGRLGIRHPLTGAQRWLAGVPGSAAMVLVAIGGTAYDGAREGALDGAITWLFDRFSELGLDPTAALRVSGSLLLAGTILAIAAIFWAGIAGMHTVVSGRISTRELGRRFVHSFIPIALAYLVAHYFTLVLFQEQAQFTYLLSDPLGDGSDYFGTAGGGIDYGLIGATAVWYVQVAALVVGHVLALVMAHDRAVAMFRDSRIAARSQYWMLALMVGFTSLGLFLLSQANQ
jgi:hypothetical protein